LERSQQSYKYSIFVLEKATEDIQRETWHRNRYNFSRRDTKNRHREIYIHIQKKEKYLRKIKRREQVRDFGSSSPRHRSSQNILKFNRISPDVAGWSRNRSLEALRIPLSEASGGSLCSCFSSFVYFSISIHMWSFP
jgi:hypothetical protein